MNINAIYKRAGHDSLDLRRTLVIYNNVASVQVKKTDLVITFTNGPEQSVAIDDLRFFNVFED